MAKKTTGKIAIIVIAVVLAVVVAAMAFVVGTSGSIRHLEAEQIGGTIVVSWNETECDKYHVEVKSEGVSFKEFNTRKPRITIEDIEINKDYVVSVEAVTGKDSHSGEVSLHTKPYQEIETVVDSLSAFPKEKFNLKVKTEGEVTYKSSNESVATVDEAGEVYLHKKGTAIITVTADETESFAKNKKTVELGVYPHQLGKIELKSDQNESRTVVLSWNKVGYTQKYLLMRAVGDGKYETFKELDKSQTSISMPRIDGKYKIKAVSDVHGTILSSESDKSCTVKSTFTMAKSYSSLHNVGTLDGDDLVEVARIRGSGKINNPQSMCFTGKNYVVAFVNRGNSVGVLKAYDRNGKLKKTVPASGMAHGNGCTYNPKTNEIMVCPTYAGHNRRAVVTFDGDTLKSTGSKSMRVAPSGITYDKSSDRFYSTAASRLYVMDDNLNVRKTIHRLRCKQSQDVAAFNGVAFSCIWTGGSRSFIDMYRISDSAYIGTFSVPMGEIESICFDDGYLVILVNKGRDVIYRTKERLAID